jgi:hypothetical protein
LFGPRQTLADSIKALKKSHLGGSGLLKDKMTANRKSTSITSRFWNWFTRDFLGIFREMRWSYLPPLMVYLAAGVSGFTGIIESFFVKEQLGLSAAFLAGLAFWAGLPWALKMPLGHLVDLFWRGKAAFVYFGATLQRMHVTMQTLGRIAIIGGSALVAGLGGWLASVLSYEIMYKWSLVIPLISVLGVTLGSWTTRHRRYHGRFAPGTGGHDSHAGLDRQGSTA